MQNSSLKRIERLRRLLASLNVEGFYTSNPTDILYLTGFSLSYGQLLLLEEEGFLYLDGRYLDMARERVGKGSLQILPLSEERLQLFENLFRKRSGRLGFDKGKCSYADYEEMREALQMREKGAPFSWKLQPLCSPIGQLRSIKDVGEIAAIEQSAALLLEGFIATCKKIEKGVRECDLALYFEIYCRKRGADAPPFPPIVAFGANSAFPHYRTGVRKLEEGDVILCDFGVFLGGYASDMTRVLFFGKVDREIHHLYEVVLRAHLAALEACFPGNSLRSVDEAARNVMKEADLEDRFLHSLGHGIGLEVHEYPFFSKRDREVRLKPGMVLTIEPGLYLPGRGGARFEEMIAITESGHRNLLEKWVPDLYLPSDRSVRE